MVEVVTGSQNDNTIWQPSPADPMMEAEMLQRLALRLDAEFNPNAQKALEEAQVQKDLQQAPTEPKADLVKNEQGASLEAVDVKEPFDRAWRTVGLVIDRMGFELVDRDRVAGYFMVRYLDPTYEGA